MNFQNDIVEKVRKLLALSKSSNINEAATAASVANKYIVQYRLSEADYAEKKEKSGTDQSDMFDDPEPVYASARVTPWKLQLACVLAQHYGCAIWNDRVMNQGNRYQSRFRLIGKYNDVKFTKYMFSWLVNEISRHSEIECRGMGHATYASYCLGAVKGVDSLLRETREKAIVQAKNSGHSSAIVRLNAREQEAQKYMYSKYHLVNPTPQKPRFNPNAFERGFDVGSFLGTNVSTENK